MEFKLEKKFLFQILKKNKFANSLSFVRSSLKEIKEELESKNEIILKETVLVDLEKYFFNQFNSIKLKWKKLDRSGYLQKKYLNNLEGKYIHVLLKTGDCLGNNQGNLNLYPHQKITHFKKYTHFKYDFSCTNF